MSSRALEREAALDGILGGMGSLLVAFSGGVDSSYLALRSHRVLGPRSLAVTADSESLAERQRRSAHEVAQGFGFRHRFVRTLELEDPRYSRNASDRCYYCKTELFRTLLPLARSEGIAQVAYGLIVDDLADFRPGHRAASEAGVRSPLAEAGLTKADVRELSRAAGLPTWDLPASPCLSSRVAYGIQVTAPVLRQVEAAEEAIAALGFREFRVRHLGPSARVEIAPDEMARLDPDTTASVERAVLRAGYQAVEVDPRGYRRGSLNGTLASDSGV